MANDKLRELYIDELKDLYNAETQLVKALPKMAKPLLRSNSVRVSRTTWNKPRNTWRDFRKDFPGTRTKP